MSLPLRAVLFDLDGTLVDSAPDLCNAVNRVLAGLGRPAVPLERLRQVVSKGGRAMLSVALPDLPEAERESLLPPFLAYYGEALAVDSAVFPGVAELLAAIDAAESVIVTTVERECEALRTGRMLAARALHTRLCDAARLYIEATKAARASLWTLEQVLPGTKARMEERREAFAAVLQVEFAVLATERDAAGGEPLEGYDDAPRVVPAMRFPLPPGDVRRRA